MGLFVDEFGIFQDRINGLPGAIFEHAEEAAVAPGVAGNPRLMSQLGDIEQQHIVVAIHADFVHLLDVAGLLALVPQLAAGS